MSHYDTLGVRSNASQVEIREAFRARLQMLHPGRSEANQRRADVTFAQVREAFEVLSDREARRRYDQSQHGHTWPPPDEQAVRQATAAAVRDLLEKGR